MSLAKVLEQINKVKPVAAENIEEGPVETMGARRGRKRNAEEQLKSLREEYTSNMLRNAVFILVSGAAKDSFSKIASENFKWFTANPEAFYEELAARVAPALYVGKPSTSNLFDVVGRHLEDQALRLGIVGYPMLRFKQEYRKNIETQQDLVNLLKIAINEQVGGEVAGIHAVRSLTDAAIERAHKETITPIILSTDDEKLVRDLSDALERLTPRVFVVVAGEASDSVKSIEGALLVEEANSKSVGQVLKNIKSQLKK